MARLCWMVVIENGCGAAGDVEAAAQAIAAVGTAFAVAAEGPVVRELAAQDGEQATAPDPAAPTEASTAANGTCGTPAGLVVGERTVQHRQPCRAAEVQRVDRWPIVKDATAKAVAARFPGSADGLVIGQRTVRNSEGTAQHIRQTAAQGIAAIVAGASETAKRPVAYDRAVAERDGGPQNVDQPGAEGDAAEGAGGVAGAADGQVVAERHVVGDHDCRLRRHTGIGDPGAGGHADDEEAGTGVAVASISLVVVEYRVRDDGSPSIMEGPTASKADEALAIGAARGVGTPLGLIVGERTSAQEKGSIILHARTIGCVDGVENAGTVAAAAAVPPYRSVTGEGAVLDREGSVISDAAAAARADKDDGADYTAVPSDGLVARKGAVGDGGGSGSGIRDGPTCGVAPAAAAPGFVTQERTVADGELTGNIQDGAADAASRRCRRGPGSG